MKQTLIIVDEIDAIYTKFNRLRKLIIEIDQQLLFQKNNIERLEWNKMFKFSLDNVLRRFDYLSTKLNRFRTHFQNQFKDFIDFIIDEIIQILKDIILDIASINQKLYDDFASFNEQMQALFNSQNFHKSITNQVKLYNNEIMRNLTHIIDAIIKRVNTWLKQKQQVLRIKLTKHESKQIRDRSCYEHAWRSRLGPYLISGSPYGD